MIKPDLLNQANAEVTTLQSASSNKQHLISTLLRLPNHSRHSRFDKAAFTTLTKVEQTLRHSPG
eukprot:6250095-Amphidinium_carterae.1